MSMLMNKQEMFEILPLWGQALAAARMARRGILAQVGSIPSEKLAAALAACDELERCARDGQGWHARHTVFDKGLSALRQRDSVFVLHALRWAIGAAAAAEGAWDFPVDGTVTISARRAIEALGNDPRVGTLQTAILLGADADLIAFACDEVGIGQYDALTAQVFGRLTPVHPVILSEPLISRKYDYR